MSVPLDRLYNYIDDVAKEVSGDNVVIYRFFPPGSKKAEDLLQLRHYTWPEVTLLPEIYCNDQEPLNYDLYDKELNLFPLFKKQVIDNNIPVRKNLNFKRLMTNVHDKSLLLHSEKHSLNIEKYANTGWIPVYYWSHAIIARDWFRYAEHVTQKKNRKKQFLIYNRAWSGTREYRLGFADRLIKSAMVDHCLMRINPVDSTINKHYDLHQFEHPEWRPENVIENYFPINQATSQYSADFDLTDYENSDIEVVLETLFDDQRIHLTEKILRPIALGQPFILAGTPNSLKYLRSYGFETFEDCWDESYDMMTDSIDRMNKIIETMDKIIKWDSSTRICMLAKAQKIAIQNKKHFFSKKFQNVVRKELSDNLSQALIELEKTNTGSKFLEQYKIMNQYLELGNFYTFPETRLFLDKAVAVANQYYLRSLSNQ